MSGRRSISRRKRKVVATTPVAVGRTMPVWVRNVIAALLVIILSAAFWMFCIRPYAYRWRPCQGQKGLGVCLPCCYDVHGIDISHYQGDVRWSELYRNGSGDFPISFVFMKATEGGDYTDDTFRQNFDSAHAYGFIRGAYHYFVPRTDAVRQADFFIRTVPLEPGDLPPVLDVETSGGKSPEEIQTAVKLWLDRVEAHYGVKPILYTSYKFRKRFLDNPAFDIYPYWIAHYYVDSVRYDKAWHFWQHTDIGIVPGISESVDLNVFNGTREMLDSLLLPSLVPQTYAAE